jgi:hypothetical protein
MMLAGKRCSRPLTGWISSVIVLAPVRRLKLSTADDSTGYVTDAIPNVGSVAASMSFLEDLELDFQFSGFYPPREWGLDYDEER